MNCIIAYTDITNKFSYKLFQILEGYENSLPCLRYLQFKENKLFFTKKENLDLSDKNIANIIYNFVNDSVNNKLFYHIYSSTIAAYKDNKYINNNICETKKNIIILYYNDWCAFCLEIFIIIDEILEEHKYLLNYFKYKKYVIRNNADFKEEEYKYDNYFNYLPRLQINDKFKKQIFEYNGDIQKDKIAYFIISKINLLNILNYNIN